MVSLYDFCMENGKEPLLAQWSGQNVPLTPQTVGHASRRKVWWRCENGHTWQAAVCNRTAGYGCPVCAGKVSTTHARRYAQLDEIRTFTEL